MDPSKRLLVLQSSSPSLRVATAPAQPTIKLPAAAPSQPGTSIVVPGAPSPSQTDNSSPTAGAAPYQPPTSTLGHIMNAARDIAKPFVYTGEDVSNAIGNAEVGLAHTLGLRKSVKTQSNAQQFGDINDAAGIENQSNTVKNFAGNILQIAPVVAAPFTGGGSLLAETGADAGLGAVSGVGNSLSQDKQSVGDYLKNALIGGALGGTARVVGAGVGKVVSPFIKKITGKASADALANAVAQEGDASTIQAGLQTTPELAHFLAQETDPNIIKDVLNESGIDTTKGSLQSLADAKKSSATPDSQDSTIPFFDPSNPTQSQLPAGWHPDGSPDPVPALEDVAHSTKSADDFKAYIDGLTGEDKAAAESALNGRTPEDFYAAAGGGSSVPADTSAPAQTAPLPSEDVAAIQAAGGKPPDALPDQKDTPMPAPVTTEAKAAEAAAKKASVLPAEDVAAIKAAGGEVPAEAVAAESAPAEATTPAPMNNEPATPVQPDVEAARQQIMDTLRSGQPTREYNKAAAARSAEKGSRSARGDAAYEAAGGGQAGMQAKLTALEGEYSKSGFGVDINPDDHAALLDHIQTNPNLQPFEKLNAQRALNKLSTLTKDGPTPYDINILRKALGDDFGDTVQEAVDNSTTLGQKATHAAGELAGVPKSIMASFDVSGTLRQGGVLASRFPKEAAAAFKDQLHYFGSDEAYKQGMAEIASRPTYQSMLDSKLAVTGTEALDKTEEKFVSNLAEKIPGFGRGVAASDRAYTGFLTKLRADVFDKVVTAAQANGQQLGQEELDSLSKFINTASGRGDLGMLEEHAKTLSTALFSPRLWKSRLDMLNPKFYYDLKGPARSLALQSAGTFAAEAGAVLGLVSLVPGVTVETDMRSSDFAKIKIGNTRLDILGGFQQNMVWAWRELTGEYKSSTTGKVTKFANGITDLFNKNAQSPTKNILSKDRLGLFGDMVQNKENPILATASEFARGKDRGGNPLNPWTALAQLVVPLPISGLVQTANDRGSLSDPMAWLKGAALDAPDFLGISSQTYGTTPTKYQGQQMPNGQKEYTGPISPNMVTDSNGKAILDKNGQPVTVQFPNGADDLTKQAMLDSKRTSALKDQYIRSLPQQTQELMKLSDTQLQSYVDKGLIGQSDFDHIKNVQKTADSVSNGNNYAVPKGATSGPAISFYQHWNSMDAKDQQAWLKQAPDKNAVDIATALNQQKSAGLDDFKPSNQLSKMYADYENDINTHPDYTEIDLRNKAKAFQIKAAQLNYNQNVQDIYAEGGSSDLKTLIANKKIGKQDLNDAIDLDNKLYAAGLETSLKFSKSFRNKFGFPVPTTGGDANSSNSGSGTGSGNGVSQQLASLVKTPTDIAKPSITGVQAGAPGKSVPRFSAQRRQNPASVIKFQVPANTTPSKGSARVTAGPFRTTRTTTLRNSVAN